MTTFKILAIDGGGIRGVIPAVWLSKIADRLGKSLSKTFDLVVGTSTGAILAAGISLDKPLEQCIDLYQNFGPTIFPKDYFENAWSRGVKNWLAPAYDDKPLGDALQKIFALDTQLNAATARTMIVSYDIFARNIYLMRSYDDETSKIPIWEACKASCSAPTYFPAHILGSSDIPRPLIDGGVFANNPSMLAISEAIRLCNAESMRDFQRQNSIAIISLGTGNLMRRIDADQARKWGSLEWLKPLIDVIFDSTSLVADLCARQIITPKNYVRLQIDLHGANDDLDDASQENIAKLKALATAHIESPQGAADLDRIVELLSNP